MSASPRGRSPSAGRPPGGTRAARRAERRVRALIAALRPYAPERIYLFGSWARGEGDELSDLDVVVIKQTRQPFFDRLRDVARLLPPGIGGADLFVYTPQEFAAMRREGNAFAEMIEEEGRLIYGEPSKS